MKFPKSKNIQESLSKKMLTASDNEDYETAASYRDRLQALTFIQSKQNIFHFPKTLKKKFFWCSGFLMSMPS